MSSERKTLHKHEIVDLTTTTSPAADSVKKRVKTNYCQTVIDLSLDDGPGDDYARNMMKILAGSRRKRMRQNQNEKVAPIMNSSIEIIDLEALPESECPNSTSRQASSAEENEETLYKQSLGPIRMEFVSEFLPKHTFADTLQNPNLKTTQLYRELIEYQLNLPIHASSSIFVRALESRLDLLRVAITGPEGSPYENGVFLFDCYLQDYPRRAPRLQFLITGGGNVRFNPNLYNCGKVCLSLLGTWAGPGWISNQSTLLQVLTSIQALVLVPDPYFNEPGFHPQQPNAATQSEKYNRNIRSYTLLYAIRDMLQHATLPGQYPEWGHVLRLHFRHRAKRIQQQLEEWVAQNDSLKKTAREIQTLLENVARSSC